MFSCPTIISPLSKWTVIAPEEGSKSTVPVVHWPFVLAAITVWWLSVRLANLKEGGGKLAQDERKLSTSYATSNWSQFRLQHNLLSCLWVPTSLSVSRFSDVRSPLSLLYWYRQNLLQFKGPIVPHKKMWGTILNIYFHEYFPVLFDWWWVIMFHLQTIRCASAKCKGLQLSMVCQPLLVHTCFDKNTICVHYHTFACDFTTVVLIRTLPGALNSLCLSTTSLFFFVVFESASGYLLFC